jgi:hypothetical protein
VDSALAAYRAGAAALGPTGDPALDQAVAAAAERLDRLAVVRAEVDQRLVAPERASATHDALVSPLLGSPAAWPPAWTPPSRPGRPACSWPSPPPRRPPAGSAPSWPAPSRAVSSASTRVRLAAAAGERLAGIDRALGAAGVLTVRDLELRLLRPDPDLGGRPRPGGLAGRAGRPGRGAAAAGAGGRR